MFVLSVISGPIKGQSIRLTYGSKLTIGRSVEASFYCDDKTLAELHAEVSWTELGFSVLDLSEKTGTFVNGARVRNRAGLRVGDHVQLGALIFQLKEVPLHETPQEKADDPVRPSEILAFEAVKTEVQHRSLVHVKTDEKAMMVLRGNTIVVAAASVDAPTIDGYVVSRAKALRALVSSPASVGAAKVIISRDDRVDPFNVLPLTIGREQTNMIALDDPGVSVRHAVIDHREGRYWVRDCGSSNGTFVNNQRVVEHAIVHGDVIGIGSHNLLAVVGTVCLGLEVQSPSLVGKKAEPRKETRSIGVIDEPLAKDPKTKKKKKKASELVWYATSDLDKGVIRARAAFVALLLGVVATGWMLARGNSEVLAGSRLATHHENETFVADAEARGRDRCTACHIGVGRVSTLKCLDCHENARPSRGHVQAEIECVGCHLEHRGSTFRSSPVAAMACVECHSNPHEKMIRERPKLVAAFSIDAPAGVELHLNHQARGVKCLTCHGAAVRTKERGVRGACRQCHAPDHVVAEDCKLCHRAHPDRLEDLDFTLVAAVQPPRFQLKAFAGAIGMLVVSFLVAAVIPRKRKVALDKPGDAAEP